MALRINLCRGSEIGARLREGGQRIIETHLCPDCNSKTYKPANTSTPDSAATVKLQSPCTTDLVLGSPDRGRAVDEPQSPLPLQIQTSDTPLEHVRTAGRLACYLPIWKKITNDPEVLQAVRGYRIPLVSTPPPRMHLQEPTFSPSIAEACDREILRLLQKGAIVSTTPSEHQFLSRFFLIAKSSGGMRFILNLKDLNSFLCPQHFQLEDWRIVVQLMTPHSWMVTLDLEDAYLLVPVAQEYRHFLRFQWRGTVFEFTVLPFGLATAPFIFTKILRPVVAHLRTNGYCSVIYLDDLLLLSPSKEDCFRNLNASMDLLSSLGFLLNCSKSQLTPAQSCRYLGFIFNSVHQSIAIPPTRREDLLKLTLHFSAKRKCRIRDFSSLVGSLISICPAVQYGLLYTKDFERTKFLALSNSNDDYSASMDIPSHLSDIFHWWIKIFSDPHQSNAIRSGLAVREIFSDASLSGWGASCGELRTHGWWSEEEKSCHINFLELKAVYYALQCFAPDLRDCEILLRVDNTTAIACINRFGSVQYSHLLSMAKQIWTWCENRNIMLFASYIASIDNTIADSESRIVSADTEWSLSEDVFRHISSHFGTFDLDLFASVINAKCTNYVSWFPDPGAIAVDAFTLSWSDTRFFAFPPFILLPRVLRKILNDNAEGVVVVPWWPSQSWFPLFRRLLMGAPLIFKPSYTLLSSPFRDCHPAWRTLSLGVGFLSGKRLLTAKCRQER